ncbi:hypothetical protein E2562_018692 [Oryza meyeriana var. granulata]|uniref:Uncharacterized protein n=1 Tax=Oryza meyeriana var. granulata TaxID=110450 RepID=A0A6G1EMN5_9ORYZ|nr:hypothetical protein E2562_018692 [Oryza meyeriana var. granulata]
MALAASAAYAPFGAAVAYPAAAPTAAVLAFALGYGALLFMLPFTVYALVFLRPPRSLEQTPYSILACAVATPAALLAAVLAVLYLGAASRGAAGDVDFAAGVAWAANVSSAAALGWCLTNGGYTAVAFSRRDQYANFMDAVDRTPEIVFPFFSVDLGGSSISRCKAVCFVVALSAACAVAGGAMVGSLSGDLFSGAMAALVLFALPMCLLYVPEYLMDPYPTIEGVLQRNPMASWYALLAPVGFVLCRLVKASATARDGGMFVTVTSSAAGAFWAIDAGTTVLLGRVIAREIAKPSMYQSSSSEIASAFLLVCLRYCLYLHVFHLIGCGGHLTWFNSI